MFQDNSSDVQDNAVYNMTDHSHPSFSVTPLSSYTDCNCRIYLTPPTSNLSPADASSRVVVVDMEAQLYYYGLRGLRNLGPKLIYRTSTDVFLEPAWPTRDASTTQLLTVHKHAKLPNNLWDIIRDETAGILDRNGIEFTSIDLVRFYHHHDDRGDITSPVTIWIGVLPDSTTSETASHGANEILAILRTHDVRDIDVAFRESETHAIARHSPILYAPVDNFDPLKRLIVPVTATLSHPIAGLESLDIEGTLGFYFKVGSDLYGVTSRHVLFPHDEHNGFSSSEQKTRKDVVLMGTEAFKGLLASAEDHMSDLAFTAALMDRKTHCKSVTCSIEAQKRLADTLVRMIAVRKFLSELRKDWSDVKHRIIGHVVWSPPIYALGHPGAPPGYMQDVCVIKLDKEKFLPNLRGNVINLGTQFEVGEFINYIYPGGVDWPDNFDCPLENLYPLKDILAATDIQEPNIQDEQDNATRFVSKCGLSTGTTLGRLNGYMSRIRRYTPSGNFDSIEVPVLPYDNDLGPFSGKGDSGAVVVGSMNEFVAQLTAGTGSLSACDIGYGTPIEWLWKHVIKQEFPDAVLFFDVPGEN